MLSMAYWHMSHAEGVLEAIDSVMARSYSIVTRSQGDILILVLAHALVRTHQIR